MFDDDELIGKSRNRLEILKDIQRVEEKINQVLNSTSLTQEEIGKSVTKLRNEFKKYANELKITNSKRQADLAREQSSLKSVSSIYSALIELDRERIAEQASSISLLDNQDKVISKIASINREIAELTSDETLQLASLNSQYEIQLGKLEGIGEENMHIVNNLIEQNRLANLYARATESQKTYLEQQRAVYDGIKNTLMGVLDTAKTLTSGPGGFFGSLLIGAGVLFDRVADIKKELGDFPSVSLAVTSVFDKNAVSNATNLASQFGGMNNVTFDMQMSTSAISKNMGITGDEAADLLGVFTRLNNNSFEMAKNLIVGTKEFAKQNGIIPSKLMAELAKNTEAFAKFSKDGGKDMILAAGAAMKLGTDLSTTVKIAEGLLDFETSINKELELSALLGRNINLDRARGLAFQGKTTEATKEALKALGGIDAFNKMDPISKQAAADLLGLQVDELQKQLSLLDKSDVKSKTILGTYNQWGQQFESFSTEFGGGFLKVMGSLVMSAGTFAKDFNAIKTLTETIRKTTVGTFIVEKLRLGFQKLKAFFAGKELTIAQKRVLVEKRQAMLAQKSMVSKTPKTPTKTPTTGAGGINPLQLLAAAAAMIAFAGAIYILALAFQEFDKIKDANKTMMLFGVAVLGMAAILLISGLLLTKAAAVLIPAAKVILAFGASILLASAGFYIVALAIGVLADAASTLGPVISSVFTSIGNAITSVVSTISTGISTIISNIKDLLVNVLPLLNVGAAFGILTMAAAFTTLAHSLALLTTFGTLALPTLLAVGGVGAVAGSLFGNDESTNDTASETMKMLLNEIKGLRNDLNSGKIAVYMDGTAVTSIITKVVNRTGVNSYIS